MVELLNLTIGMWTIFFVFLKTTIRILNCQHPNLDFTIEEEHMKQLPFLDVFSTRSERLITSVYRKSTFTGLLQNYNSFVPFTYKKGLIKTLID